MIPSLEALALTAILGLSDRPAEERPELELVAADVALAVEFGRVPFLGPAAREAAALALVAIAWHESGFAPEVGDCRRRGDLHLTPTGSVSLWQLLGPWARGGHPADEVCQNQPLAAYLALGVLDVHARRCTRAPWRSLFDGYASGRCGHETPASGRQCAAWARLAASAGLVASCDDRRPITWRIP